MSTKFRFIYLYNVEIIWFCIFLKYFLSSEKTYKSRKEHNVCQMSVSFSKFNVFFEIIIVN